MTGISCVVTGCGSGGWICKILSCLNERDGERRESGELGKRHKQGKTKRKREINKILDTKL